MSIVHFLDVGDGDCSIIQHRSGNVSMIDVCNARSDHSEANSDYENPILYLKNLGINELFRFIATHPDMDHIDGISDIFSVFKPINFWCTENQKEDPPSYGKYREKDWKYYKQLRDKNSNTTKRLTLYSGDMGLYYNMEDSPGGICDYINILAPEQDLIIAANQSKDGKKQNDASYVILHQTVAGDILFCGDSEDKTWKHIRENHFNDIQNVKLMIAPHHGRDSNRSREFLDDVRPCLTLFGRAPSEHLGYDMYRNRDLNYITNNQAGSIIAIACQDGMHIFVRKKEFAESKNGHATYCEQLNVYYYDTI